MTDTFHHNAPRRAKLLRLSDKYTGWLGESYWSQRGKKFIKRLQRRYNRRWSLEVEQE